MMIPGESYDVDDLVAEDNRDMFIKLLCAFIMSGTAQGYYFNETFTKFHRATAPITQTKENNLKQKQI